MFLKRGRRDCKPSGYLKGETLFIGLVALSLALSLFVAVNALAGEYHVKEQACSECHTAHFSQHGRPPAGAEPGGPFERLLLFSSPTKLCLSCHDGSDVDAPDVLEPVTTSYAPDRFSAGGYFQYSGGTPSANGHDLGVFPAEVPFSGMAPLTVQCTTCHNPHGNEYYRNLEPEPGIGGGTRLVHNNPPLPTDHIFEESHPTGTNPSEVYRVSNIAYRAGISDWCAECHDRLLPNQPGALPAHFQAHPADIAIGYGASVHVDERHWLSGTGAGFGDAIGDGLPGIPRVRFQTPSAISLESARLVSAYNEVFCATCHFAHGGPYAAGATWPYKEPAQRADAYAPCQQCHNQ